MHRSGGCQYQSVTKIAVPAGVSGLSTLATTGVCESITHRIPTACTGVGEATHFLLVYAVNDSVHPSIEVVLVLGRHDLEPASPNSPFQVAVEFPEAPHSFEIEIAHHGAAEMGDV